jgi:ATP adenylyltransferase/5',5'''-P-1,P-4-tetraphosphate phosphorylase II
VAKPNVCVFLKVDDLDKPILFARYDSHSTDSLSSLSIGLLEQQKKSWPQLTNGYASLQGIRIREIVCDGFSVRLQFNPGRLVSSSAKVDAKSIAARKCFLCRENLPVEQQGVLYGTDTLILCNPAPIFNEHYTLSNTEHTPQSLRDRIPLFLNLAKDLAPHFSVFYNGPKCGASVPDHMHFQASPMNMMPIEMDVCDATRRDRLRTAGSVALLRLQQIGREVLVLESANREDLAAELAASITVMQRLENVDEEPKINVICSFTDGQWRVIIFPRSKHRPDVFFEEGEKKVMISPASVDIGGLVITPLEHDFHRVDASLIESIYREVSVPEEFIHSIADAL